jgi:hypothetical protein
MTNSGTHWLTDGVATLDQSLALQEIQCLAIANTPPATSRH